MCLQVEAKSVDHIKQVNKGLENKIIELQQRLDEKVSCGNGWLGCGWSYFWFSVWRLTESRTEHSLWQLYWIKYRILIVWILAESRKNTLYENIWNHVNNFVNYLLNQDLYENFPESSIQFWLHENVLNQKRILTVWEDYWILIVWNLTESSIKFWF